MPGSNTISSLTLSSSTAWHTCRRLIYVPRSAQKGFAVGFWPIPESFWPDLNSSALVSSIDIFVGQVLIALTFL